MIRLNKSVLLKSRRVRKRRGGIKFDQYVYQRYFRGTGSGTCSVDGRGRIFKKCKKDYGYGQKIP